MALLYGDDTAGRGYGGYLLKEQVRSESSELSKTSDKIENTLQQLEAEMQAAAQSRSSASGWGSLFGLGLAYLFMPSIIGMAGLTAGTWGATAATAAGWAASSWLGSEAGETIWDHFNLEDVETDLGIDVPGGLFFSGQRDELVRGQEYMKEALDKTWDITMDMQDEAQLTQALTVGVTNFLNPLKLIPGAEETMFGLDDLIGVKDVPNIIGKAGSSTWDFLTDIDVSDIWEHLLPEIGNK